VAEEVDANGKRWVQSWPSLNDNLYDTTTVHGLTSKYCPAFEKRLKALQRGKSASEGWAEHFLPAGGRHVITLASILPIGGVCSGILLCLQRLQAFLGRRVEALVVTLPPYTTATSLEHTGDLVQFLVLAMLLETGIELPHWRILAFPMPAVTQPYGTDRMWALPCSPVVLARAISPLDSCCGSRPASSTSFLAHDGYGETRSLKTGLYSFERAVLVTSVPNSIRSCSI
jgi:hypothetical protein